MAQSTVKLIIDAQNAITPLKRVNESTKKLSQNTNKLKGRIDSTNRSLRNTGRSAKAASGGINTLKASVAPLLKILALIGAVRFIFVQTAELETQRASLEKLTGSLSKTNSMIAELQKFGAVTPFTSSELIEQTRRLKAFGFETDKVVDTTKRIADVAGTVGADLNGIATAFGQIQAKGKLQQEENLQLLERGVNITDELKKITGLQGDAFESAMRKGQIGADLVNQALINLTNEGGAFFGGASAQSDTLNGKLSTLVDSVQTLARTVGGILEPVFKRILDIVTGIFQGIDNAIKRIQNIKQLGFGNVLGAEKQGKQDALKATQEKFGGNVRLGLFGNKEAKAFFNEQKEALTAANIEAQKLKETQTVADQDKKDSAIVIAQKNAEVKKLLDGQNVAAQKLNSTLEPIKDKFAKIGKTIGSQIEDALVGAINGTKSLGDAAKDILSDLANSLIKMGVNSILGGVFGGTKVGGFLGFANGGRPPVGRASIVGERGPELFVPSTAGTIIPNNKSTKTRWSSFYYKIKWQLSPQYRLLMAQEKTANQM